MTTKKYNLKNFKKIKTIKFVITSDYTMKKNIKKKRVVTKNFKLNRNNQYGLAMSKPLQINSIKQNFDTNWKTFNLLLQKVSLDDQIGHLNVVDIETDHTKATEKQLVYNEIYPPIIEKQKIIYPCESTVYQLLEQYSSTEKVDP